MEKIILIFVIFFGVYTSQAQDIKTLEWWRSSKSLETFGKDLDTLSNLISKLNDSDITSLKKEFDTVRQPGCDSKLRKEFKTKIRGKYQDDIEENIESIRDCNFYKIKPSSFLYYYINKELNDYISTLEAFMVEAKELISEDHTMSVFNNSNFLNAYFNVSISRSLLLAAMNNLERYFLLGSVADEIKETSLSMTNSVNEISCRTMLMKDSLDTVNLSTKISKALLTDSFLPYKPLKSKSRNNDVYKSGDKISTAANTILIDNRKNWWWRSLAGGVIGGLVAGLLVIVFN